MIGTAAFFISPAGQIKPVLHTHIKAVIDSPEEFGTTSQEIAQTYQQFEEPMGLEGRARERILNEVIRRGWIRLRRYKNKCWSVTMGRWTEVEMAHLAHWAGRILEGVEGFIEDDQHLPIRVVVLGEDQVRELSFDQLVDRDLTCQSEINFCHFVLI